MWGVAAAKNSDEPGLGVTATQMNASVWSSCLGVETGVIGDAVGYRTTVFNIAVAVIAVCGVLYLFATLFLAARRPFFSAYAGVTLLAAFALLLTIVQRMLPVIRHDGTSNQAYADFCFAAVTVILCAQWAVQCVTTVFLCAQRPEGVALLRVAAIGSGCAAVLLLTYVGSAAAGRSLVGQLLNESLLVVFFAAASLPIKWSRIKPRRAASLWSVYMLVVHLLFLSASIVRGISPGGEAGSCLYLAVDLGYYAMYAPSLMFVLLRDSGSWSKEERLLSEHTHHNSL